jgi:hypothetical protein
MGATAAVASAVAQVAAMLESLAAADRRLADELDEIAACRVPVCKATVQRLDELLGTLRVAVLLRDQMAGVPVEVLDAAIRLRRQRLTR